MNERDNTPYRLVRMPIIEPLNINTVYEHMPLDIHRYGPYPRYISPPGTNLSLRCETVKQRKD